MNIRERVHQYYWNLTPETPFCINCKHFHRHYVLGSWHHGRYTPIDCGHCVFPRMKERKAYDTCEHFKNKNESRKEGGVA